MPAAFLPSPARGVWNLGPIPIRGSALCLVLGVLVALWVTDRRYRKIGGRAGLILDVATFAVPAGLIAARLYSLVTDYSLYFGHRHDWVDVLRIWDGGLGLPGAIAGGAFGAWIGCRRAGVDLRPVVAAAVPALAFGQAIAVWGNWFDQSLDGQPSMLPWAVEISPVYRVTGYESSATFQPVFLYESVWYLVMAVVLSYAIRMLLLTGDRAFACYAALYAIGGFGAQALVIGSAPRLLGLRVTQVLLLIVFAAAVAYLYVTRAKKGPDVVTGASLLSPDGEDGGSEAALAEDGAVGDASGLGQAHGDAMAAGAGAEPTVG